MVKDGLLSLVYNKFTEQICLATGTTNLDTSYVPQPGRIHEVASMQARLGEEAFLKGFIHIEWTRILNKMWRPAPPDQEGKRVRQKDALEQTVSLLRALWDIFEAQWTCRNDILHGKESKINDRDTGQKTTRLIKFRINK